MRLAIHAVALLGVVAACAPAEVRLSQLTPVRSPTVTTAADLYARADSATRARTPQNAGQIAIVSTDSTFVAFSLYEMRDIFYLDVYVYNGRVLPFNTSPSQLMLLDANRTIFRQLAPHEAANVLLASVRVGTPYQPKYTYDIQSSTLGYVSVFGNTATYTGTTQTTVTPREDESARAGYVVGAAIAARRNRQLQAMAGNLYAAGLIEGSAVPSQTGAHGGIYWLKRREWSGPVILRLPLSNYEIQFDRVRGASAGTPH